MGQKGSASDAFWLVELEGKTEFSPKQVETKGAESTGQPSIKAHMFRWHTIQ